MAMLHRAADKQHVQSNTSPLSIVSSTVLKSPHLLSRTTLRVTGPLLLVGACTAVALASTSPANSSAAAQPTSKPTASTHVNLAQSAATTQPSQNDPSTTTTEDTPANSSVSVSSSGTGITQVTVNGQSVAVPQDGITQQTITSPDGSTSLTMSSTTNGSSSNRSSSSTNVTISNSSLSGSSGGVSATVHSDSTFEASQ